MSETDSKLWNAKREALQSISNNAYESKTHSKNMRARAQIRLAAWEARLASERQLDHHRERESRGEREMVEKNRAEPLQVGLFESFTVAQRDAIFFFPEDFPKSRERSDRERE